MRIALAIALMASAPAWAVNKCTAADGSVTFQEAPCPAATKTKESVRVFSGGGESYPSSSGKPIPKLELTGTLMQRASVAVAALENLADMSSECKMKLKVYGKGPESRGACLTYLDHSNAWYRPAFQVAEELENSVDFKDSAQYRSAMRYLRRIYDDQNFIDLRLGVKN